MVRVTRESLHGIEVRFSRFVFMDWLIRELMRQLANLLPNLVEAKEDQIKQTNNKLGVLSIPFVPFHVRVYMNFDA